MVSVRQQPLLSGSEHITPVQGGAHRALTKQARLHPDKNPWLMRLLARRPAKVVAVALANKIARIAWVLLARGGTYRVPPITAAS